MHHRQFAIKKNNRLYLNCLDRNVIWLNLTQETIKISIFDRLGNIVKTVYVEGDKGILVPPQGYIKKAV